MLRHSKTSLLKFFFKAKDTSLVEYAANVDMVFSNKDCAHILEHTETLMKQPLHATVPITPLEPSRPLIIQDERGRKLVESTTRLEKLLAIKSLNMPQSQISLSVWELVELIYTIWRRRVPVLQSMPADCSTWYTTP